jgi:hypothetical protein
MNIPSVNGEIQNNERYLDYYATHELDVLPPFNRNATVMCSGTTPFFAKYTVGHDYNKLLEVQTVAVVQIVLCQGLCVLLAIATFVTLHHNRRFFSKVNGNIRLIRCLRTHPAGNQLTLGVPQLSESL